MDTQAKVVDLSGRRVDVAAGTGKKPNAVLVETLEDLLKKAIDGDVVGAAIVLNWDNDMSGYILAGRVGGFAMVGCANVIQQELIEIARNYD